MASKVVEESATKLFSKFVKVSSFFNLEKTLFPNFASNDVVEIYGESGSGKTELLYHFIAQCILPQRWKAWNLNGLGLRVIFIDNDCRFNLLGLISIIETRLKALEQRGDYKISSQEIALLINERVKFLEVAKCNDTQQFLITLCSLETLLSLNDTKSVLMIDGITSFYWCDKMRMQTQPKKLLDIYSKIFSVIRNISQEGKVPVLMSRRRIFKSINSDRKILGGKSVVTWSLELSLEGSKPDGTMVTLSNNNTVHHCVIGKFGFVVRPQKEKHR